MESHTRKISPKGKAIPVGNIIAINGYHLNRLALKQRFLEGNYQLHETPHFILFTREETPTTIIIHWFAPEEIDDTLGYYFFNELTPLGVLAKARDLDMFYSAIVGSLSPFDLQHAWSLYGTNTLRRYRQLLANPTQVSSPQASSMQKFARLYARVQALRVGNSFLDVGCAFGFFPLLLAEQMPLLQIVGVDVQAEAFTYTPALAETLQLKNVRFAQADLLADDFSTLGRFDTVVALHVLEHFSEEETYAALSNLLHVTSQRLLLAVPYEQDAPVAIHGHKQLFSRTKLESLGKWCLEQWKNKGQMHYEDCTDGLLLLERHLDEPDSQYH